MKYKKLIAILLPVVVGSAFLGNYLWNKKIDSRVQKNLGGRTGGSNWDNLGVSLRPLDTINTDVSPRTDLGSSLGTAALRWANINANTGTIANLLVTYIASSSQYDYLPVNTTSRAARVLINGASTENPLQITSSTGGSMLTVLQNGNVGINTSTPIARLSVVDSGAGTNDILDTFVLSRETSGTAAVGFGSSIVSYLEDASGFTKNEALRQDVVWTDATSGSEDSRLDVSILEAGTVLKGFSLTETYAFFGGATTNRLLAGGASINGNLGHRLLSIEGDSARTGALSIEGGAGANIYMINFDGGTVGSKAWLFNTNDTNIITLQNISESTLGLNSTLFTGTRTGLFGINTTTPAQRFTIQATSTENPFAIVSSTGGSMLTVLQNGNVGIGTSSPEFNLSVSGTVAFPNLVAPTVSSIFVCSEADGQLRRQATNCTASSARFKENIYSMSPKDLMEKVRKLRAIGFDFKNGRTEGTNGGGKESEGFLAEEVAMIDPMLVVYTDQYSAADLAWERKNYPGAILYKNGKALIPQTVDYARVSVLLTGALQNMDNRVSDLESGQLPETKIDWMWKSLTALTFMGFVVSFLSKPKK